MFFVTRRVSTCDTAATALWQLGVSLPENMDGKPVATAFSYPGNAMAGTVAAGLRD